MNGSQPAAAPHATDPPATASPGSATTDHPLVLKWSVHPARSRPWATAFALFVIVTFAIAASLMMQQIGWGLFCGAAFFLSLRRFFFTTEVEATPEQMTVSCLLTTGPLRWTHVRRYHVQGRLLTLSTRARPSILDHFRNTEVPLPSDPAIQELLRSWWERSISAIDEIKRWTPHG